MNSLKNGHLVVEKPSNRSGVGVVSTDVIDRESKKLVYVQRSDQTIRERVGTTWAPVRNEDGSTFHPCAFSAIAIAEAYAALWIEDYKRALGTCPFAEMIKERLLPSLHADGSKRNTWRKSLPEAVICAGKSPYWVKPFILAQHIPLGLPDIALKFREILVKYTGTCAICSAVLECDNPISLNNPEERLDYPQDGFWLELSMKTLATAKSYSRVSHVCHMCNVSTELDSEFFRPPRVAYHRCECFDMAVGDAKYAAVAMVYGDNRHFVTRALCPESKSWFLADDEAATWPEGVAPMGAGRNYTFLLSIMVLETPHENWVRIPKYIYK